MGALKTFLPPIQPEEVISALKGVRIQEFEKGIILLREGSTASSCYFLMEGKVQVRKKIEKNLTVTLGSVQAGQFFGEMAMLSGVKRSGSALAMSKVKLLELTRADFEKLLQEGHPIATRICLTFATLLAERASKLAKMLVHPSRLGKAGKRKSAMDIRQVLHKVYSVCAV